MLDVSLVYYFSDIRPVITVLFSDGTIWQCSTIGIVFGVGIFVLEIFTTGSDSWIWLKYSLLVPIPRSDSALDFGCMLWLIWFRFTFWLRLWCLPIVWRFFRFSGDGVTLCWLIIVGLCKYLSSWSFIVKVLLSIFMFARVYHSIFQMSCWNTYIIKLCQTYNKSWA